MIKETVYVGFSNVIEWVLVDPTDKSDPAHPLGKPYDFVSSGVTKMELCVAGQTFSSEDNEISYFDGGIVRLTLGGNDEVIMNVESSATLIAYKDADGDVIVDDEKPQSKATIKFVKLCS